MRKPYYHDEAADGLPSSQIDWRGSPWRRVKWFLFGEFNFIRTLAIVWVLVVLSLLGAAGFVIHHFVHKYW
jgi:hypothetical protein